MSTDRENALAKVAALFEVCPENIAGAPGGWFTKEDRPGVISPLIELRRDEFGSWLVACDREPWQLEDEYEEFGDADWYWPVAIIDLDGWRIFARGYYDNSCGSYEKFEVRWMWMPLADVGEGERAGAATGSAPAQGEAA
jgi:hypothetical protein